MGEVDDGDFGHGIFGGAFVDVALLFIYREGAVERFFHIVHNPIFPPGRKEN